MIVFLGSNPSCTSPVNDPFSHCKSANKMLNDWIPKLGLIRSEVVFKNVANYKTVGNKPLSVRQINIEIPRLTYELDNCLVVTLGKTAEKAILKCLSHNSMIVWCYALPHPSGLNRLLNDKEAVEAMLQDAKRQIELAIHMRSHSIPYR
jgi:uracil-DNA glycosylase